jgi:RimJ/RimL family protein N-acetyltransferase
VSAFAAATIVTERLLLVPLRPEDTDEMVDVLADPRRHQFIGGHPATLEELRARYARLTAAPHVSRRYGATGSSVAAPTQGRSTPCRLA